MIADDENASQTDSSEEIKGTIVDPSKFSNSSATDASATTAATDTSVSEIGSGAITFSSSSLGITVKKKVTFYSDGHMTFEPVEEQK